MFVRKRKGSNQLIEKYKDETGGWHQRVVENLGPYETPEEALEAARRELDALEGEAREKDASVAAFEKGLRETYAEGLFKWHGGEIPPLAEVSEKVMEYVKEWKALNAPEITKHYEVGPPVEPEGSEAADYAKSFETYDMFGPVAFEDFVWHVRALENRRGEAKEAREGIEGKAHALKKRIATLERVLVAQ